MVVTLNARNACWCILILPILVACAPPPMLTPYVVPDEFIWTAIAQTEAFQSTTTVITSSTYTPSPTSTPTITRTPTATETPIPSFTPVLSPTPDLNILTADPQEFLLKLEDLPPGAGYYIPFYLHISDGLAPYSNKNVLADLGPTTGQAFIDATKRVDGWRVIFHHKIVVQGMPEEIACEVARYQTIKGARMAVMGTTLIGWQPVDKNIEVGDVHQVFSNAAMYTDGTRARPMLWYAITFSYRNFSVFIRMWGWSDGYNFGFVEQLARVILEKMEAAPLSNPEAAPWVTLEVTPLPGSEETPSPNPN